MIVECSQCRAVGRHGMVGEEASDHLLEPDPLLGNRFVHAPPQFLLDLPERCPHAIAPCCSFDKELPTAVAFADEGKPKKVEGLRFSEPAPSSSFCRKAAELDQAGLVRIERQREPHCPVPFSLTVTTPFSRTPAFNHFWIRRIMRRSPMRCSTNRTSQSLLTESKKEATSASKMKFTRLLVIPTTSASSALC